MKGCSNGIAPNFFEIYTCSSTTPIYWIPKKERRVTITPNVTFHPFVVFLEAYATNCEIILEYIMLNSVATFDVKAPIVWQTSSWLAATTAGKVPFLFFWGGACVYVGSSTMEVKAAAASLYSSH